MQQLGKSLVLLIWSIFCVNISSITAQYEEEHNFNFSHTLEQQESYMLTLEEFSQKYKEAQNNIYISAPELQQELTTDKRTYILDVRNETAYNISHIENAHQIGFKDFNTEKIWMIPKKGRIIVYCTLNEYSNILASYLTYLGYKDVAILHMSIIGWVNAGFPVYDKNGNKTNKIMLEKRAQSSALKKGKAVYN